MVLGRIVREGTILSALALAAAGGILQRKQNGRVFSIIPVSYTHLDHLHGGLADALGAVGPVWVVGLDDIDLHLGGVQGGGDDIAALTEDVELRRGRVSSRNLDSYIIPDVYKRQ